MDRIIWLKRNLYRIPDFLLHAFLWYRWYSFADSCKANNKRVEFLFSFLTPKTPSEPKYKIQLSPRKVLFITQTNPLWHLHGNRKATMWDKLIGAVVNSFCKKESVTMWLVQRVEMAWYTNPTPRNRISVKPKIRCRNLSSWPQWILRTMCFHCCTYFGIK